MRRLALALGLLAGAATGARGQAPAAPDTIRVEAGPEARQVDGIELGTGERIVVRVVGSARPARPEAGPGPVGEAGLGEVVARFEGGPPFAWPGQPTVWTAPRAGQLTFDLNGYPAHRLSGGATIVVRRLGPPGSPARASFAPPTIALDRDAGGVVARYADRAGFGLDLKSLRFTLIAADGTVVHLSAWGPVGSGSTRLALPPPVPLRPGVHALRATITDRLGNAAQPATMTFDWAP